MKTASKLARSFVQMSAGDWKERGRMDEMCCGCGRWGHEQVAAQTAGEDKKRWTGIVDRDSATTTTKPCLALERGLY